MSLYYNGEEPNNRLLEIKGSLFIKTDKPLCNKMVTLRGYFYFRFIISVFEIWKPFICYHWIHCYSHFVNCVFLANCHTEERSQRFDCAMFMLMESHKICKFWPLINQFVPPCFPSYRLWLTIQIIKSVSISESVDINQLKVMKILTDITQ